MLDSITLDERNELREQLRLAQHQVAGAVTFLNRACSRALDLHEYYAQPERYDESFAQRIDALDAYSAFSELRKQLSEARHASWRLLDSTFEHLDSVTLPVE